MNHRSLIRIGNVAAVFGLVVTTVSATLLFTTPVEAADDTSSSVSVAWASTHTDTTDPNYDEFKNLNITVGQTKNLVNQGVTVSWTGGVTTSSGDYSTDYLQIMQCWGDEASGPTQQQCQWGAPTSTVGNLMGTGAAGRDLNNGEDVKQTYSSDLLLPAPETNPNQKAYSYPFTSVKGVSTFDMSEFFTSATTNEVSAARTGTDGTGSVVVETQTALEAPHLGCGAVETKNSVSSVRSCWLVVVPRGKISTDGTLGSDALSGRIAGSPFSASNWSERVAVKLDFQPVSQSCPIGNAERRVVGSEFVGDAMTSWQPLLCVTGTTYGFSQIGDGEARRQIVSGIDGSAALGFVSDPLDETTRAKETIEYAPVTQSAVVVAFNIDYSLTSDSPVVSKNGTLVKDLTLNARLIAKLLTQSYRVDVPGLAAKNRVVAGNPMGITVDPEFLALNPEFSAFTNLAEPDGLIVALGSSDAAAHVWAWLRADPDAAAFLSGKADPWDMQVNPTYKDLALDTDTSVDSFPKADLSTYRSSASVPEPGYGTLDMRPYTNDFNEAAYRALKADAGVKINWDETKLPPAFVSGGPQQPGEHFMLALTDASAAARYGLSTAKLVTSSGEAIAPTATSITAGVSSMVDSTVTGVKVYDPTAIKAGAYPLSMLTYAAINMCVPDADTLSDYAKLLKYAVGAGQVSGEAQGQLPRGYVPLASVFKAQTATVVADLKRAADHNGICALPSTPTPTPTPTVKPTKDPVVVAPPQSPTAVVPPAVDPAPTVAPVPTTPAVTTTPTPTVAPVVHRTVDAPLPTGRLGLLAALALGVPTMIAGPVFTRRGRKLARLSELQKPK